MTQSKNRKKVAFKQKTPPAAKKAREKPKKPAVKKDSQQAPSPQAAPRRPLINFPK
jgi:hypothetical protein